MIFVHIMTQEKPNSYPSDDPEIFQIYKWGGNLNFNDYLILWSSFAFVFVTPFLFVFFCFYSFICIFYGIFWPMGTVLALFLTLQYKFEPSSAVIDSYVTTVWMNYFNYEVIDLWNFDVNHQLLFAEFHHGVLPIGMICSGAMLRFLPKVGSNYPLSIKCGIADSLSYVPGLGHLAQSSNCVPATRRNVRKCLEKGDSVALSVGGIAELLSTHPDKEIIVLKERRGFVKQAVETGTDLLVVYHFGNSRTLDLIKPLPSSISRKLGISLMIPIGRFFLPIPYRQKLVTVFSKPIEVKKMSKNDAGFDDYVELVHGKFVEELKRIYFKFRHTVPGWEKRPLEII